VDSEQPGATTPLPIARPGLIWGFDLGTGEALPIEDCDGAPATGFRWLHFSLAHQGTAGWLSRAAALPPLVKDMLLSPDTHQRALIEDGVVACVLHDAERDFEATDTSRTGVIRFALTPTMMITARLHPIRSPDLIRERLAHGAGGGAAAALDLLISTISEIASTTTRAIGVEVQRAEDHFLDGRDPPSPRSLIGIRRRVAMIHRQLDGMRAALHRLEEDEELPETIIGTVEKHAQRLQSLAADTIGVQGQLRLLRDEIDIQTDQRTNQNLYVLSIMTALMLPATFVTGLFGMNTGGMPWQASGHGTISATLFALAAAVATYVALRMMGLMRR
jgi:zinc transporter